MDYVELLSRLEPFAGLDKTAIRSLIAAGRLEEFEVGAKIIAAGEPGDAMYVVGSGTVRVPVRDEQGHERYTARLGPGDIFGEMALLTGEPRRADVYAASTVECLVIQSKTLQKLLRKNPQIAAFLTQILGERLEAGGQISQVGKYRLLGEIGRGGVAIVYAGVHPQLQRTVAVKMLSHSLVYDREFASRFRLEASIIAQLEHENIVRVYDCESAYATEFIVMEMLPGSDLQEYLHLQGPLSEQEVRSIVVQLASALDYAHRQGIVHRDIKPENIIIDPGRPVKLTDFGLAWSVTESNGNQDLVGTPEFMSPEQGRGDPIDGRTDIYALGVVAFELLTGKLPHNADDPFELIDLKCQQPCPDVRTLRPDVSELMASFIAQACAIAPSDRFADGAEIIEHFKAESPLARADLGLSLIHI